MDFEKIGARIRNKRLELKLTQEKLAEKTGLTETYIGAIERATSKCSIDTLANLSQVLNISVDYLLFGITVNNVDTRFSDIINSLPKDKQNLYIEICEAIADKLKK